MLLLTLLLQQTPAAPQASPQSPATTAPAPKPAPRPARFKVAPDQIQHFGEIGPREVRTVSYVLTNTAAVPMGFRISNNSPGTVMDDTPLKTPLAPGESRTLTMRVDPAGFVGYQRRAIRLEPTAADEPYNYVFRADMTVRPEVAVDAERKSMGSVASYESPEVVFTFKRETGDPLDVTLDCTPSPYLDVELEPHGSKTDLRVTLRPSKLQNGQSAGLEVLKVKTNGPLQPAFTLYLEWRIKRPVEVVPSRLVFDQVKDRFQSIELKGAAPFSIQDLEFDRSVLTLTGQTQGETTSHRLTFYRRVDKAPDGKLSIRIKGVSEAIELPVLFRLP
jgi:hypothetical protein